MLSKISPGTTCMWNIKNITTVSLLLKEGALRVKNYFTWRLCLTNIMLWELKAILHEDSALTSIIVCEVCEYFFVWCIFKIIWQVPTNWGAETLLHKPNQWFSICKAWGFYIVCDFYFSSRNMNLYFWWECTHLSHFDWSHSYLLHLAKTANSAPSSSSP